MPRIALRPMSEEFKALNLGDTRLNRRVQQIADALAAAPSAGLPRASRTTAALEATYRLLSNPRVEPKMILEPHLEETRVRAFGERALLAIHDTTEFGFGGETRANLGRTHNHKPGFFAHVSLGVRASDREPVGLLACRTWARQHPPTPKKERRTARYTKRVDKESNRWKEAVDEIEDRFEGSASLIHVVDREGDQYRLMAAIVGHESRFIVRSSTDRALFSGGGSMWHAASKAEVVFDREVQLSRRRTIHKRAVHGPRDTRTARLGVSATPVEMRRAHGPAGRGTPPSLTVNVVRVVELDPPDDVEPVTWILLTNLPVERPEEIEFVVDCYRARWMIEEFFKAVKTGCAYEKL